MTPADLRTRGIENDLPGVDSTSLITAIVQSSDDAIVTADLDGTISSWNPGAERMFGFTQAEMPGRSIAALISPELRLEQTHIFDRVKTGEHVDRYETVRITKAGERIDVSLTLSPLKSATGAIVGISGILRDISSQRRSERALLHRLRFEKFLFELSRTFIGLTEEEVDANMANGLVHVGEFLEMDRVSLLELSPDRTRMSVAYSWSAPGVPKTPAELRMRDHPWWADQVLRGEVSLSSDADALPPEAAAEKQYLSARGIQSVASIPLRVGGEIAGVIAFATVHRRVAWTDDLVNELRAVGDILWNALKRHRTMQTLRAAQEAAERASREAEVLRASEERYRGLAEQVVDAVFITDAAARALDANRAACELLGYTLDELKTLAPEDVIATEDLPTLREMLTAASRQIVHTEFHFKRKNGSVFVGEVAGRQLPDGRLQAVVRDVSERRETEESERRLHRIAMLSFETATMQEVLDAIVEAAIATSHADFGNMQLLDADSSMLHIVAHRGFSRSWIDYWAATSRQHGACGTALNLGKRVVIEDVERSPIFSAADLDMQRQAGVRAVQSTPLVSRAGKPIGMLSTHYKTPCRPDERTLQRLDLLAREAADIIGHAQAEAAVKRQAALLNLAQNSILVRDFDGHILFWNEGATKCYSWTREEALGKVAHTLLQTRFPQPLEEVLDIVRQTGHWEGELGHVCRDGRRIIVDSRWTLEYAPDEKNSTILQINNDITERKRAEAALREREQQLQSYIDQAGDAIYVLDGESGRILNANRRAAQMLGYTVDELLRLSAPAIEASVAPATIENIHQRARRAVVEVEGVHRRKDGSTFPVEIRMTALTPASPSRILSIVRDVSERKRLEQERAEELRRKDEFLAVMGHELRNPLAAIHTASHVLSRNPTPEQRARMEDIIDRQTTIMRRLVDDLLDLERITHGHIELKLGPVTLDDCLHRAVATVQSTIADRKQELLLQAPGDPVRFIADGTRLEQIAVNLLTNASKYSPRGGRIELSGVADGSDVVIRCKDNGQGISPEYQQKIFEPFFRGPKTDLGYGEASVGLGLALVKQLTQLHGGTISVESRGAGFGSEFTVRLPWVAPRCGTADEAVAPARASRRPRSIVIVEDNPNVSTALRAALEQAGHSVHVFADGASAVAAVSKLMPDAILIDVGLPGMDGYKVAAVVKQQTNTKRVVLVGISGFKRRVGVGADSFDHYFNKPVDVPALLALLDQE